MYEVSRHMVYLYHTQCVSSCQRGKEDVPSQHVQAYHPCMTMGSDMFWDVHGDHDIPSRGNDVDTRDSQRQIRALERTVPDGIQTQQKSAETAENPPALAATSCHHTPSTVPDTPRECRPSCH